MRITIIGGGAIGLLLAAHLHLYKLQPEIIVRSAEQHASLCENGLLLTKLNRDFKLQVRSTTYQHWIDGQQPVDWVLVTVKQMDLTEQLIDHLAHSASLGAAIVCFQNGAGHLERLRARIDRDRLYAAVTTEAALRASAVHVIHTGNGETRIGKVGFAEQEPTFSLQSLMNVFNHAGLPLSMSKSIMVDLHEKLLMNVVINPLTALMRVRNGELLEKDSSIHLMRKLYNEAVEALEANGLLVVDGLWERLLAVCERTASNQSSMLQDIMAGRRTELEWLNGYLIRIAGQKQVNVPTHQVIYDLISGIQS